jgi:ferredoxin-NADP reductase
MSPTLTPTLPLRVRALTWEAEGILGVELVPTQPDTLLPPFEAGSHIDLHLGNGLQRSYSLLNTPGERERYCVAVNLDAASRGGSSWIHAALRPGQVIEVSAPRNNFALDESAAETVLIAGGIGVTPLLSMARRLTALGKPWRLLHATRTRAHAAFARELQALAQQAGASVSLFHDQEPGGQALNLASALAALPAEAHVYCCGPLGMLEAFEKATADWPRERVHVEYFAAKEAAATDGGYTVTLQRSGRSIPVQAGQTLLECLIAAGVEPPWSCGEGVCGTCETRVLQGVPDHRDLVLTDAEHAKNDRMMVCCSGSKTATLVLDL